MTFDPTSPFTRAEGLAAGLTDWRLRSYHHLFRTLYLHPRVEVDHVVRARAALRLAPDRTLLARHTAAQLLGGVVPSSLDVHLAVPTGRLRVAGIDARRATGPRMGWVRGFAVTPPEETFVELAGELGLVDLVVLGDSLVAAKRTTPDRLRQRVLTAPARSRPLAVRAAGLVRTGVDSPMESRLRMLLVLAGLPEPVVNHVEEHPDGRWHRRFDLAYPLVRVAVEYDGRQHAEDDQQWEHDVSRREGLDQDDWRLVVVLAKGVYREPDRTLARVQRALAERGLVASVTSREWEQHFPVRRSPR